MKVESFESERLSWIWKYAHNLNDKNIDELHNNEKPKYFDTSQQWKIRWYFTTNSTSLEVSQAVVGKVARSEKHSI